jgi:hypothetical protein
VVDDRGRVWVGPAAFEMCLWATAKYRSLAYRMSQRGWSGFAAAFFEMVSSQRGRLGAVLSSDGCEACDDLDLWWEAS